MNAPAPILATLPARINAEHALAQQCAETAVQHAVRCGQLLLEVKGGLKHGEYEKWVSENCRFAVSTARLYTTAAKQIANGLAISSIRGLFPSGGPHVSHNSGENEQQRRADPTDEAADLDRRLEEIKRAAELDMNIVERILDDPCVSVLEAHWCVKTSVHWVNELQAIRLRREWFLGKCMTELQAGLGLGDDDMLDALNDGLRDPTGKGWLGRALEKRIAEFGAAA